MIGLGCIIIIQLGQLHIHRMYVIEMMGCVFLPVKFDKFITDS